MTALYDSVYLDAAEAALRAAVGQWGLSPRSTVALLNISENATFRVDDPEAAAPVVLRVHRPGYHSATEIRSELAWIDALRAASVAIVPEPLAAKNGERIVPVEIAGAVRDVVAFAFVEGTEPAPSDDLEPGFRRLGAISAALHAHARAWRRPSWFVRKRWTHATTIGPAATWGNWRAGPGLTPDGRAILERACAALDSRLEAYGTGPDRFGLIHADLRLANLLVDGDRIALIDFDDCGFGWFAFDFAAAVSFFETDPCVPALRSAWCAGYREVAPLAAADEAELDGFVLLRRMQLTAWIASHAETPTARAMGPAYTEGTVALADRYLSAPRPPL